MPSLHDMTPLTVLIASPPANIRVRLGAGASALAIATIMRRKDTARALN